MLKNIHSTNVILILCSLLMLSSCASLSGLQDAHVLEEGAKEFSIGITSMINYGELTPESSNPDLSGIGKTNLLGVEARYRMGFGNDWDAGVSLTNIYILGANLRKGWMQSDDQAFASEIFARYGFFGEAAQIGLTPFIYTHSTSENTSVSLYPQFSYFKCSDLNIRQSVGLISSIHLGFKWENWSFEVFGVRANHNYSHPEKWYPGFGISFNAMNSPLVK